jgi:addiction module toxin, RelE/StbE family
MVHPLCLGYEVTLSPEAQKNLKKIDNKMTLKILKKLEDLTSDKLGSLDIKKLKEKDGLYRLRIGDYRIIYSINRKEIIIFVVKIGHRKNVYDVMY